MAFPFKSGGDFYTQELLRVRLQNFDGDLPEYGTGSIYHNTSTGLNTSDRIRYRGKTKWYSVANMDDIQRLEDLIEELDFASSGDFSALIKRVQSVEDNFTDGVANDSQKLGGQLPSYYATAASLNDLVDDYESFKEVFANNSDEYINTWIEVKDFLDGIKNTEDLNNILLGINTELGKKADKGTTLADYGIEDAYTKAESNARYLQLTGGTISGGSNVLTINRDSTTSASWIRFTNNLGGLGYIGFSSIGTPAIMNADGSLVSTLLHSSNYSDLITKINGDLSIGGSVSANFFRMANGLIAMSYVNIGTGRLYIGYGTATENQAETYIWGKKLGVVNPSGQTLFDIDENGNVHVTGNLIVEGEVSAKGKGQEGGENTGGGFQLFDETNSWDSYEASMQDWILTAYHGKLFNDRISLLENKATKVEVSNLLSSGTKIATIKVDNNSYDVLAPFADAYTKTESDARYLLQSGGTINSLSWIPLKMVSGEADSAAIILSPSSDNGLQLGWSSTWGAFLHNYQNGYRIGVHPDGYAYFNTDTNRHILLHSGNVGDYALKTDGSNKMTAGIQWQVSAADDWDIIAIGARSGLRIVNCAGEQGNGAPNAYSVGLSVSGYYGFNIAYNASDKTAMFKGGLTNSTWKTIAFTDSDITGNAASATKLADNTAFTAWGRTFFENGKPKNVSGDILLGSGIIYGGTENTSLIDFSDNTHLYLGYGVRHTGTTFLYGNNVILRYGTQHDTGLFLNSSGNVTIGDQDYAGTDYKLHVGGSVFIGAYDSKFGALGTKIDKGFVVGTPYYGVQMWTRDVDGNTFIQSQRFDTGLTAYDIIFQHLGGNVGIGTTAPNYKLHVGGDGYFSSNLYIGGHMVSKLSDFYMFYDSSKIFLQVGPTGVFLGEGTQDTTYLSLHGKYIRMVTNGVEKMRITEDGTVRVDGSFTAGATTLSSLIVNNAATFNGGVDIPMGQSLKIGDATIKYEAGALKVDKSIHSEGEVSAKGKGTEGAGGTTEGGGNAMKAAFNIPMGSQSHICEHNFHTREVTVCIYEDSGDYQQVLADVYLDDENNVRIQFGSATDVPHRVIIMA